jgi:hypothetical protein
MLQEKLDDAFTKVADTAAEFKVDWRTSAYIVALRRLEKTYKERGIFPIGHGTHRILKERADRRVVVLSPAGVARLAGKAELFVQRDAGRAAGFTNEAYEQAGAQVLDHEADVMTNANILLSYDHHYTGDPLAADRTFIGFFNFLGAPKRLRII